MKLTLFVLTNDPGSFKTDAKMILINSYATNAIEYFGKNILGLFSDLYIVVIIFFFYSITYLNNKRIFNILLLISSMPTIINGVHSGGRTQMIYWLLIFISCHLYFKNQMTQYTKTKMKYIFLSLLFVFSFYFIGVTISRFSNTYSSSSYSELLSIAEYSGMSFLKFNEFFVYFHHDQFTLARIFPILYDIFADRKFDLFIYRNTLPMDIGIFYTFIGDLFVDIGVLGTFIYLLVFRIIFHLTQTKFKNNVKPFHQVLLLFMLFQIPLNGLFYYSLYNKLATISIVCTVIIALSFKSFRRSINE